MSVVLSIGSWTRLPTAGTASVPVRAEAGQLGGATVPPVSPLGPLFPVMTAFLPGLANESLGGNKRLSCLLRTPDPRP